MYASQQTTIRAEHRKVNFSLLLMYHIHKTRASSYYIDILTLWHDCTYNELFNFFNYATLQLLINKHITSSMTVKQYIRKKFSYFLLFHFGDYLNIIVNVNTPWTVMVTSHNGLSWWRITNILTLDSWVSNNIISN